LSDVFISYARENVLEARSIADALHDRGLSVFWDRTIPAGRTFEHVIEEAIGDAKAVVVLWSQHSIRSDWVRAEAAEGANRGILVPATLDGASPPLRYRVAQTANLADWTPGRTAESLVAFLNDVAQTVRTSQPALDSQGGDIADRQGQTRVSSDALARAGEERIRQYLKVSIASAWLGSLALAVTLAYDYAVVAHVGSVYLVANVLTIAAMVLGAVASATLGALSLRRQLLVGILQGWVWPVVGAVGQVVILMLAARLIRELPFTLSGPEGLFLFVLCGTIGPGLLTVGAVVTNRALTGISSRG
jgi:hypothetical protein